MKWHRLNKIAIVSIVQVRDSTLCVCIGVCEVNECKIFCFVLVVHRMRCEVLKLGLLARVGSELTFVITHTTRHLEKVLFCLLRIERHINTFIFA